MHKGNRSLSLLLPLAGLLATAVSVTAANDSGKSGATTGSALARKGSTGAPVGRVDAEDKEFFNKAGIGGLFEVQAGQMARDKAQSADVKEFGIRMITDHTKANNELKQVASKKGLIVPTELDKEKKSIVDHLGSLAGKDFDKAYISHMVDDHEKDVKEFEKASKETKDADLRNWAKKTLPVLQEHLRLARQTQNKLK